MMSMSEPDYDETDMSADEFEGRMERAAATRRLNEQIGVIPAGNNVSNAVTASPDGGPVQVNLVYRPTGPLYRVSTGIPAAATGT